MKRLALVFALVLVAACGSDDDDGTETGPGSRPTTTDVTVFHDTTTLP